MSKDEVGWTVNGPNIRERTYEKMKFALQQTIATDALMDGTIETHVDEFMGRMVVQIRHSVWAYQDKVETTTDIEHRSIPATWWDSAKQTFRAWALTTRFPFMAKAIRTVDTIELVIATTNEHKHYHLYPNADLRSPHNTVKMAEFEAKPGWVR